MSTAGPFALYGTPVVDACVRLGTHYVDITGETAWVHDIITAYHERAAADGTRIIPCCGFDSVPSDLGALLVARHLQEALGVPCAEARGYVRLKGGLNGGTVASLLNLITSPRRKGLNDPFLLDPPGTHSERQKILSADLKRPRYDPDAGFWTGPFVMAATNTRVVRRSAALYAQWGEPYGPDFVYTESSKYTGRLRGREGDRWHDGLGAFIALLRQPLTRRVLATVLPKPGAGPSTKTMDEGWFTCELLGIAEGGKQARGVISYQGDPGNRATVTFLCESALALALQRDTLPGGRERGGVLTPATALGPCSSIACVAPVSPSTWGIDAHRLFRACHPTHRTYPTHQTYTRRHGTNTVWTVVGALLPHALVARTLSPYEPGPIAPLRLRAAVGMSPTYDPVT